MSADDGGWGIGGYVPVGYEVTPWASLFPALARHESSPTLKAGYLAKIYTYYLTRMQFGQYLGFLSDVGPGLCDNSAIYQDSRLYGDRCGELLESISQLASSPAPLTAKTFDDVTRSWEEKLTSGSGSNEFYSSAVYHNFFANYGFFISCAYGLIIVNWTRPYDVERQSYRNVNGWTQAPRGPFNVLAMLADSVRLYPGMNRNGDLKLWWYQTGTDSEPDSRMPLAFYEPLDFPVPTLFGADPKKDPAGFDYYPCPPSGYWAALNVYPVGFGSIPSDYDGMIMGMPMFRDMPFDFLAAYAMGSAAAPR